MEDLYKNAYGTWEVTTEGDVEGRSTSRLGTYTGYLDEIAFHLANKCYYSLRFKAIPPQPKNLSKTHHEVSVSLEIDSGTWDLNHEKLPEFFKQVLGKRKVSVKPGNYFASVILIDGDSPEEIARRKELAEIETAKSKLTKRERNLLGLED